jgi:integrase
LLPAWSLACIPIRGTHRVLVGLRGASLRVRPKTRRSDRVGPRADVAPSGLSTHLEEFGSGQDGLILHHDGHRVARRQFGDVWRVVRKRAGLPDRRYHDARHTFASVLLLGGVSIPAAAEYLGDSPAVLLATYAHLIPADHDRARSAVQSAFAGEAPPGLR